MTRSSAGHVGYGEMRCVHGRYDATVLKFLRHFAGGVEATPTQVAVPQASAHVTGEEDIPRYPPFMKGLPVCHPDKLLESQSELVDQIRRSGAGTKGEFETYYLEPLRRFAAYVHLLPASEAHHHRGAGGLFRHATEVALWSLQAGERVLLPGGQTPLRRREIEPRWQLALFLAGLCHDAGKPISDLVVTSRDGASTWNPFVDDLHAWAMHNQVDRYFLHWRANRGKNHTVMSILVARRIIGEEGLAWIAEGDRDLVLWMFEVINGQKTPENILYDLVVRSDQISVTRDHGSVHKDLAGYDLGIPVERILVDIMRRLLREGRWTVNAPGSRLWLMEGHLYLVWPAGGEEIVAVINQEKMPGLPRTPGSILDLMVERNLVSPRGMGDKEDRIWAIAPTMLAEKIPNIRLSAIRLRDPAVILDSPIPSVSGVLVDRDESVGKDVERNPESLAKVIPPPAVDLKPEVDEKGLDEESRKPDSGALDSRITDAFKILVNAIQGKSGEGGKLACVDPEGVLCLRWPDAFKGIGLDNKTLLEELSRREWLLVDPLSPFRKVSEINMGSGAPWKVIRLQPSAASQLGIDLGRIVARKAPVEEANRQTSAMQSATAATDEKQALVERRHARQVALIARIVKVLRDSVNAGTLSAMEEDGCLWIKVRDAELLLKTEFKLTQGQALALGDVVRDEFASVDRERLMYFRIRTRA